jgi:hypothetical protein
VLKRPRKKRPLPQLTMAEELAVNLNRHPHPHTTSRLVRTVSHQPQNQQQQQQPTTTTSAQPQPLGPQWAFNNNNNNSSTTAEVLFVASGTVDNQYQLQQQAAHPACSHCNVRSFARNTLTQRLFVFRCHAVLVNTLSRALTSSVEMQIQPAHTHTAGGLRSNNALSRIRTQVSDQASFLVPGHVPVLPERQHNCTNSDKGQRSSS